MNHNKGDWVTLNNFPSQGPFLIEHLTETCYHIDFGDGLEVTYEVEVTLAMTKDEYREKRLKNILDE